MLCIGPNASNTKLNNNTLASTQERVWFAKLKGLLSMVPLSKEVPLSRTHCRVLHILAITTFNKTLLLGKQSFWGGASVYHNFASRSLIWFVSRLWSVGLQLGSWKNNWKNRVVPNIEWPLDRLSGCARNALGSWKVARELEDCKFMSRASIQPHPQNHLNVLSLNE